MGCPRAPPSHRPRPSSSRAKCWRSWTRTRRASRRRCLTTSRWGCGGSPGCARACVCLWCWFGVPVVWCTWGWCAPTRQHAALVGGRLVVRACVSLRVSVSESVGERGCWCACALHAFPCSHERSKPCPSYLAAHCPALHTRPQVLVIQGFLACRKHHDRLLLMVRMMSRSGFPCFKQGDRSVKALEKRFQVSWGWVCVCVSVRVCVCVCAHEWVCVHLCVSVCAF